MRWWLALLVSLPSAALADEAPQQRFGSQGTWSPGGSISVFHRVDTQSSGAGLSEGDSISRSSTSLVLRPSFDYFIAEDLSLGVGVLFGYESASGLTSATSVGVSVAGGYHIPFNASVGLYPKLTLSIARIGQPAFINPVNGMAFPSAVTSYAFDITAPLLLHMGHFFIGGGPQLYYAFERTVHSDGGGSFSTGPLFVIGAASVFGGWF